jgi:hypothetical protein
VIDPTRREGAGAGQPAEVNGTRRQSGLEQFSYPRVTRRHLACERIDLGRGVSVALGPVGLELDAIERNAANALVRIRGTEAHATTPEGRRGPLFRMGHSGTSRPPLIRTYVPMTQKPSFAKSAPLGRLILLVASYAPALAIIGLRHGLDCIGISCVVASVVAERRENDAWMPVLVLSGCGCSPSHSSAVAVRTTRPRRSPACRVRESRRFRQKLALADVQPHHAGVDHGSELGHRLTTRRPCPGCERAGS